MAPHEWTRFETHTLLHLLVRGDYQTDPDPLALPTALNYALHRNDHSADINHREIQRKAKEIMDKRPAFTQLFMRHRSPKITRTLMRSFERGLKVSGERSLRARDAVDDNDDAGIVRDALGQIRNPRDKESAESWMNGTNGEVSRNGVNSRGDTANINRSSEQNRVSASAPAVDDGEAFDATMLEGWGEGEAEETGDVGDGDAATKTAGDALPESMLDGWGGEGGDQAAVEQTAEHEETEIGGGWGGEDD